MSKEKFYITTPIYFPSGKWHLGTCYTTVTCDTIARFNRLLGKDVFFLTGTDEHGQKMERLALNAGVPVMDYINKYVYSIKDLWKLLDISYDKFIRTTDKEHEEQVKKIFQKLYDKGDIYKNKYEGWYCTPCESFWTETQLVDGMCPDCHREVKKTIEESYFFRLSKYQDKILKLLEDEENNFLEPKTRQKEMIKNFLEPGLQDLCVTRSSFKWGIEVPFDNDHVIYVWIDALTNYITALNYAMNDNSLFKKYWPCDVHMVGKEIVRFHSIIWPAILMALEIELPKKVYGHGWLLFGNDKISKSKGNAIADPFILSERYTSDAVRYYLLKEIPMGSDGIYTNESFLYSINSDLANNLGNLVSRCCAMCVQYFNSIVPKPNNFLQEDKDIIKKAEDLLPKVKNKLDKFLVSEAISLIFDLLSSANKYIDITTPWVLAKDESKKERLQTVIYVLLETIRIANVVLQAFLTKAPGKIFTYLGINDDEYLKSFKSIKKFGELKHGTKVKKGEALFNRIDVQNELIEFEKISKLEKEKEIKTEKGTLNIEEISIDDFSKISLKVGTVKTAEKVQKSNKLLKMQIEEENGKIRTIVSGIAMHYSPEELIDKQVVFVANLKPVKLCGIESEGMILCASSENNLSIISPAKKMKSGSEVN